MPISGKKQIHRNGFKWIQIVAKDMLIVESKKDMNAKTYK